MANRRLRPCFIWAGLGLALGLGVTIARCWPLRPDPLTTPNPCVELPHPANVTANRSTYRRRPSGRVVPSAPSESLAVVLAPLLELPAGEERFALLAEGVEDWAETDPDGARRWITAAVSDGHLAAQLRAVVMRVWVRRDVLAAATAAAVDDQFPGNDASLAVLARFLAERNQAAAVPWIRLVDEASLRASLWRELSVVPSR